jgi:hypothetical protein
MDDGLKDEIWRHRVLRGRGDIQVPELDGHGYLTRAKLAALLMLLTDRGRTHVTPKDWELATILWETSCKVRDHYLRRGQLEEAKAEMSRARKYADREAMAEAARQQVRDTNDPVDRVARKLANDVHDGKLEKPTVGYGRRLQSSRDRKWYSEALEYATEMGWVVVDEEAIAPGPNRPAN